MIQHEPEPGVSGSGSTDDPRSGPDFGGFPAILPRSRLRKEIMQVYQFAGLVAALNRSFIRRFPEGEESTQITLHCTIVMNYPNSLLKRGRLA